MADPKESNPSAPFTPNAVDNDLLPQPDAAEGNFSEVWQQGVDYAANSQPVGTFVARITDAVLGRAASSGRLQITYKLTIEGGDKNGIELVKYDGLGSAQQASITQGQLTRLGIDPSKVNEQTLPVQLLALKGKLVVISTKKNGSFFNIFFQKLAGDSTQVTGAPSAPASAAKPNRF
jgi:hypothetical protein